MLPITPQLQRRGFAVMRGLYPPQYAQGLQMLLKAAFADPANIDNARRGTMLLDKVPNFLELAHTPKMATAFYSVLGPYRVLAEHKETIAITGSKSLRGTVWHQEADTIPEGSLICWVNLTSGAGSQLPGLAFLNHKFNAVVPALVHDYLEEDKSAAAEYHEVAPHLSAGDAVFFDRYAVHRTHVTESMGDGVRYSVKITAVKCNH